MKLMVAVADYPNNSGGKALMYVHTRNKYYLDYGIDVTVLNFAARNNYTFEGINIITLESYKRLKNAKYNILVCHAANIRNHYIFLKKYSKKFTNIVFFFHGHEVLKIHEVYPKPFDFDRRSSKVRHFMQNGYDNFKLRIWHNYLPKIAIKSEFIFVSKWLLDSSFKYMNLTEVDLLDHVHVIHNGVGNVFEEIGYNNERNKEYDFITIRANMDSSKYGVDIVNDLAKSNPNLVFLIIGKGNFFNKIEKAQNIVLINRTLIHSEMIDYINQSKCALLPTRLDAQGVMACEMLTFGIPLITSDIPICREIFNNDKNVCFINNENPRIDLHSILKNLEQNLSYEKNKHWFAENTVLKEVKLYESLS